MHAENARERDGGADGLAVNPAWRWSVLKVQLRAG